MKSDSGLKALVEAFTFLEDEKFGIASGNLSAAVSFFERRQQMGDLSLVDEASGEKRADPSLILESYQSAIVLFKKYPVYALAEGQTVGQIASLAVGEDYHRVHKKRLTAIAEMLSEKISGFEYKICVDTTPLFDRQMAFQTGLVFYGKHQQVILPEWGAGFSIGYLLTNQVVEPQKSLMASLCGDCTRCIEACPTKALSENGFASQRCISFISQKKGDLSTFEESTFNNYVYGCDICLLACPYTHIEKDIDNHALVNVSEVALQSNSEIKAQFRDSAILWKGAPLIRRNASFILSNRGKV